MLILKMRIQERHITENSKRYMAFMPQTGLNLKILEVHTELFNNLFNILYNFSVNPLKSHRNTFYAGEELLNYTL